MDLTNAIKEIFKGNAVLFCGAGFSRGAINRKGNEVCGVEELLDKMSKEIGEENDGDLEYISGEFLKKKGEISLIELLEEIFTIKEVKDYHRDIINLPWKRIYTTNYDNVIEIASNNSKKTITLKDIPNFIKNLEEIVIHLNGSINNLNKKTLDSEFKLTEISYLNMEFRNNSWYEIFYNDLDTCKAVFFIGYSFNYDLDIKRIVTSNDISNKIFFINGEKLRTKDKNRLNNYGQIIEKNTEMFSREILQQKKEFDILPTKNDSLSVLKKYKISDKNYLELKIDHIFKLLIGGDFLKEVYFSNLKIGKYLFKRDKINQILMDINERKKKIIILHSDLGNGKTIYLEILKKKLIDYGDVYTLTASRENSFQDLEKICQNNQKTFLIIENYNTKINILENLEKLNSENIILILTARSYIHDLTFEKIKNLNYYSLDIISEYNLNSLSPKEVKGIINYLNKYNLWGEYSNETFTFKKDFIENKCAKNLSSLLLKLFNSSKIRGEIEKIVQNLSKNSEVEELFILILINNIIGGELKKSDFISYLDLQGRFDIYIRDDNLKQILLNKENKIQIKSSILGKYILDTYIDNNKILNLLIKIMKKLDNYSTPISNNLKFLLISFSNFQLIIKDESEENIVRYYEEIRSLKFCKENTFFWIQYANARISIKDFEFAELCLKNAYAYRKRESTPHYDTCYARFLLEKQILTHNEKIAYTIFKEAHYKLLNTKNEVGKWHFPFKQTQLYYEYYKHFYENFTENEKSLFLNNIIEMLDKINKYKKNRKESYDDINSKVFRAEKSLKKILSENKVSYNNS